jgi:PAS domain S-box-containing protein
MQGIDFQEMVELCPEAVAIYIEDQFVYINLAGIALFKAPSQEESIIGKSVFEVIHSDYHEKVKQRIYNLLSGTKKINETIQEKVICYDGSVLEVEVSASRVNYQGQPAIQVVFKDNTHRKNSEKALQVATSELHELSAPLVPVMNKTAILPLIGLFTRERAEFILNTVPGRVSEMNLNYLIIDCSGVGIFHAEITRKFLQMQKVLLLLGVSTIFTGIRPTLVQNAVLEGIDFSKVMTCRSVQEALEQIEAIEKD